MALHTELPIHKVAYDLLDLATDLARGMPRDVKPLIGAALRDECFGVLLSVYRANVARNKVPHLEALLEHGQVAELLLRLSRDKRLISTGQYARAIALTASIGKQAHGWKKSPASSPVA